MRIAIVDDEEEILRYHRQMVERIGREEKIPVSAETFSSARNLLYEMEEGAVYDMFLLDVEMPHKDGIALTEELKKADTACYVVFITSHLKYLIEGYELEVFRYIPKFMVETKLPLAIRDVYQRILKEETRYYLLEEANRREKIAYRDILYLYKDQKNTVFARKSGESHIRRSLREVYEELDDKQFIWIDKGCIVNVEHVQTIYKNDMILDTGEKLDISKPRLKTVKSEINDYWRGNL